MLVGEEQVTRRRQHEGCSRQKIINKNEQVSGVSGCREGSEP